MVVVQNLGRNWPPSYTKWADSQLNDDADNDDDISRNIIWLGVASLGKYSMY